MSLAVYTNRQLRQESHQYHLGIYLRIWMVHIGDVEWWQSEKPTGAVIWVDGLAHSCHGDNCICSAVLVENSESDTNSHHVIPFLVPICCRASTAYRWELSCEHTNVLWYTHHGLLSLCITMSPRSVERIGAA
jgi:hypothetical protein